MLSRAPRPLRSGPSLQEESVLVVSVVKWFVLATAVGLVVGGVSALFLRTLAWGVQWSRRIPGYFLALPPVLAFCAFVQYVVSSPNDVHTTDDVIARLHRSEPVPFSAVLRAFVLPLLAIVAGGSTGKEAPAADMGAGLSSRFAALLRLDAADRRKLMICGVSAGFAAVFGTPLSGAIFGVEVLFVGSLLYDVLLPAFVAGIVGCQVTTALGVRYFPQPLQFVPRFSEVFFLKVALAGVFFGLCAFLLIEAMRWAQSVSHRWPAPKPVQGLVAGAIIAGLALLGATRYLGMGLETIQGALEGASMPWSAFLLKILTTMLTLGFGGPGGIITPIFFVGATAGASYASLLGLSPATFAAIGMVSVLAGAANTPIAASILAVELFGSQIAPYAAVSCIVSFLITGHRSVYPSQVLAVRKSSSLHVKVGDRMEALEPAFQPRAASLAGWLARLATRRRDGA